MVTTEAFQAARRALGKALSLGMNQRMVVVAPMRESASGATMGGGQKSGGGAEGFGEGGEATGYLAKAGRGPPRSGEPREIRREFPRKVSITNGKADGSGLWKGRIGPVNSGTPRRRT